MATIKFQPAYINRKIGTGIWHSQSEGHQLQNSAEIKSAKTSHLLDRIGKPYYDYARSIIMLEASCITKPEKET